MQNPQILELIENLKGRRNYEEKKPTAEAELSKEVNSKQKKTCSCC